MFKPTFCNVKVGDRTKYYISNTIIVKGGNPNAARRKHETKKKEMSLSQEDLAEKLYVSRQTISNWENEKSYPDINSLVLLSEVFGTTIDNLIKGDVEIMKEIINQEDVNKFGLYSRMMAAFFLLAVVLVVPLSKLIGLYALIPFVLLWGVAMFFAFKIGKNQEKQ